MRGMRVLACCGVVVMLAVLSARAGVERDPWIEALARAFEEQPVQERTLANGLRVLVLPRGSVPWCAVATVLPGGAREDPEGLSGLAHLSEHLLFESDAGSDRKNTDVLAEALGMRSNAFTLPDYTVLVEEFSPAVLDEALSIHRLRLQAAGFEDGQLAREKRVVADERRFRVDEPPLGRAEELLLKLVWQGHPHGRPVLGWPVDVAAIRSQDARQWMRARSRPERAVLALVGRVDAPRALAALERMLAGWQRPAAVQLRAPGVPASPPSSLPRGEVRAPVDALLWGARAAALGSPDESVDRVVARLLDGDPYYRLQQPPDVMPEMDLRSDHRAALGDSELIVTATPLGETEVAELGPALRRTLDALAADGPATEALVAARTRVAADHQRELEIHAALAERLAVDRALVGRWNVEAERLRVLARVGVPDVRRRAAALRDAPWQAEVVARAGAAP